MVLLYNNMSIITQAGKIGTSTGGSKAWKVSYNAAQSKITLGYGTMFYNGKFFTTNDLQNNPLNSGFLDNSFSFGVGDNSFIYVRIFNPFSLPTETDSNLKIFIQLENNFTHPEDVNTRAPLVEYIPLAYVQSINGTITIIDLRTVFGINNFTFLA